MTSEERHAARRERRTRKREEKRREAVARYDTFANLTDLNSLREAARRSRAGVSGKASVQKYFMNELCFETQTRNKLLNHEDVREGFIEFDIHERGHARHIRAMHFKERVVQRCLCDNALVPVLRIPLVYDNGASLKGKGIHFAIYRMREQLRRHYRKFGTDGYILQTDFSKYFDNLQHEPVRKLLERSFTDRELIDLTWDFVTAFGDSSLGIGSQVSQIFAVAYPNRSDHYTKEVARVGKSGRYMDDSYAISEDRETLENLLIGCKEIWNELGILISERKTHIIPLRHFTFLKVRYILTETGKVIMKPHQRSFTRMRRKLRSFRRFLNSGDMTIEQVLAAYKSWCGYQEHFNCHKQMREMDIYFYGLFGIWVHHKKPKRKELNHAELLCG